MKSFKMRILMMSMIIVQAVSLFGAESKKKMERPRTARTAQKRFWTPARVVGAMALGTSVVSANQLALNGTSALHEKPVVGTCSEYETPIGSPSYPAVLRKALGVLDLIRFDWEYDCYHLSSRWRPLGCTDFLRRDLSDLGFSVVEDDAWHQERVLKCIYDNYKCEEAIKSEYCDLSFKRMKAASEGYGGVRIALTDRQDRLSRLREKLNALKKLRQPLQ